MAAMSSALDKNYLKIPCSEIQLGVRFSAPVFFDDGKNMFLAERKTAKQYHIDALKRWKIPYLLSFGHKIDSENLTLDENFDDVAEVEELEEI
ncbi:phosphohydrolase [uncultured Treponema sp.]|uniref:phosphohydrolase n=1 Tax=uncultured Treponema sp. TaxID=162155 RepID=UPI0025F19E5E|nr:phosphohydrolase [uncultured Treponema sp.]